MSYSVKDKTTEASAKPTRCVIQRVYLVPCSRTNIDAFGERKRERVGASNNSKCDVYLDASMLT